MENYLKPDFLIIGAMKAGTTTLYSDLAQHPEIYLPSNKEPEVLCKIETEQEMFKCYKRIFWNKKEEALIGEASTAYSMFPDYNLIPEKAYDFIGDKLKVIYLVRDPIDRIISHHYHDCLAGRVDKNINEVVFKKRKYIDYSKYWMQVSQWLEMYEKSQIKIISFEEYIVDRENVLNSIQDFLGVSRNVINTAGAANVSSEKLVPGSVVEKLITKNPIYRNYVKPILPKKMVSTFSQLLMDRPKVKPEPLREEVREAIYLEIKEDYEKFSSFFDVIKLR